MNEKNRKTTASESKPQEQDASLENETLQNNKETNSGRPPEEKENLQNQVQEYKDKYIRLCAEFDNVRKRYEREKTEYLKYANERLLVDFLSIMDDLDRSVAVARAQHQDYAAFLKGIEMVMARVRDILKTYQVKPIEAVGQKFNPHFHEILMQVESEDVDGVKVIEEFQKGYYMADRVIRTAKVKVAVEKSSPGASSDPAAQDTSVEESDDPENIIHKENSQENK